MKGEKIQEIFIFNGEDVAHGFKMLIKLEKNKVLYFNSLWLHYFDSTELEIKHKFKKIEVDQENILEVYCFEGVGHYLKLESEVIICIHQEITFVEDSPLRYTYKLIYPHQTEDYNEIITDFAELGDSDEVIYGPPKFW